MGDVPFEDELETLVGNQFFPKHVAFFNCPSNTTFYSNSSITAVALTSSTDPGAVVNSFTGNSISITTPTGMLSGAPHQWTFNIQDTGSPPVTVPEPSSFAILMLGGAGFWLKRRRQAA